MDNGSETRKKSRRALSRRLADGFRGKSINITPMSQEDQALIALLKSDLFFWKNLIRPLEVDAMFFLLFLSASLSEPD